MSLWSVIGGVCVWICVSAWTHDDDYYIWLYALIQVCALVSRCKCVRRYAFVTACMHAIEWIHDHVYATRDTLWCQIRYNEVLCATMGNCGILYAYTYVMMCFCDYVFDYVRLRILNVWDYAQLWKFYMFVKMCSCGYEHVLLWRYARYWCFTDIYDHLYIVFT